MGLVLWVFLFVALTALVAWVVFWDGADRTGGIVGMVFLGADTDNWSDDGIRLFAGAIWLAAAVWFFYGLNSPGARLGL